MESSKSNGFERHEALLRFLALCLLLLAAVLMGTDSQIVLIFEVYKKKVDYKIAKILITSMYVHSVGAGYSFAQLIRCLYFNKPSGDKLTLSNHILRWIHFLLDQVTVYIVFATNCATTEIAVFAIFGAESLQWMKLCNRFTRFCVQMGWSVAFGLLGSILLAVISSISAFNLLRWYSPNFLCLKPKKISVLATNPSELSP